MKIVKTVALFIMAAALAAVLADCTNGLRPTYVLKTERVVLAEGGTIWDIAGRYYDKQDKIDDFREFVWTIRKANGYGTSWPQVGDVVIVPLYCRQ